MGSGKTKIVNRVSYIKRQEYNLFIKKYPTSGITYIDFINILKGSNMVIKDQILDNPLGFKAPYNLGYFAVDRFKTSKKFVAIDWVNTKKLGKVVPLTNFHSFGHAYKIKLYKNPKMVSLFVYKMDAHRLLKRQLAKYIKEEKRQYIHIDKSYYSKRFNINKYLKNE